MTKMQEKQHKYRLNVSITYSIVIAFTIFEHHRIEYVYSKFVCTVCITVQSDIIKWKRMGGLHDNSISQETHEKYLKNMYWCIFSWKKVAELVHIVGSSNFKHSKQSICVLHICHVGWAQHGLKYKEEKQIVQTYFSYKHVNTRAKYSVRMLLLLCVSMKNDINNFTLFRAAMKYVNP